MWLIDRRALGAEYLCDLTGQACKIFRRGPMITALFNAGTDALEQAAGFGASEATAKEAGRQYRNAPGSVEISSAMRDSMKKKER